MSRIYLEMTTAKQILKTEGLRALFSRYGWKLVFVLFCYYLVRDISLYVILPFLIGRTFYQ